MAAAVASQGEAGQRTSRLRNGAWVGVVLVAMWLLYIQATRLRLIPADEALPADRLVVMGLDGRPIDLEFFRGEVVAINLWASWCGPCRAEIPALARTHAALADRGLRVLGVNVEGLPPARVAALQRELGMTYPGAVQDRPLVGTFEPSGVIPETWLVDRRGRVRASHTGLVTESAFRRACERLLDEPRP